MIHSHKNPLIKTTISLRKSSARRESGKFLIDGHKELAAAIQARVQIESVFHSAETKLPAGLKSIEQTRLVEVSSEILSKLSYGDRRDNVVAVGITPDLNLQDLNLHPNSLILVLDKTEKPGNIGACLRSAVACGVDAVILSDPICEALNPNAIRASRGAVFQVPIAVTSAKVLRRHLTEVGLPCFCARVDGAKDLWDIDFHSGGAFVFGNEADGLHEGWDGQDSFQISTAAAVDSLNLSISTAVTFYEAMRQRSR